ALGDTFLDLFLLSLQSIADEIAWTATTGVDTMPGIVEDIVDINFGEDEPCPRIVVSNVGDRHEVTAQAIDQLMRSGALTPDPALEAYVRQAWRLPERTDPAPAPAPRRTPPRESQDLAASRPAQQVQAATPKPELAAVQEA